MFNHRFFRLLIDMVLMSHADTPAKDWVQKYFKELDSRFRRNDVCLHR